MLLFIMIATDVIGIPVDQELSQDLLDVVQSFLLNSESLLLCLHSPMKIIIIVVCHVSRHEPHSYQPDGS